jgi:hypothetical protein
VPLSWPKRVKNGILRASNYQEWFNNILAKSGFISKYTNYRYMQIDVVKLL